VEQNGEHSWDVNHQKRKNVTSMEWEQFHVIKVVHVKGTKLNEIATECSNAYGPDVYAPLSIRY
jgi:hypothetical protein